MTNFQRTKENSPDKLLNCSTTHKLSEGNFGDIYEIEEWSYDVTKGNLRISKPDGSSKRIAKFFRDTYFSITSQTIEHRQTEEIKFAAEREHQICMQVPHLHSKKLISENGNFVLVMRKMPGISLKKLINDLNNKYQSLNDFQYIKLAIALLDALKKQVHDHQLVHCDIKPENIMIDLSNKDEPIVNIIDYGLAKNNYELDQRLCGTIEYLPPESLNHGLNSDEKNDIFALGKCLFKLLWDEKGIRQEIPNSIYPYLENVMKGMTDEQYIARWDLSTARNKLQEAYQKLLSEQYLLPISHSIFNIAFKIRKLLTSSASINISLFQTLQKDLQKLDETSKKIFLNIVSVGALKDCDTIEKLTTKYESILSDYQEQEKQSQLALKNIKFLRNKYQNGYLFKKELFGTSLNKYEKILSRKIEKFKLSKTFSLEELVEKTNKMKNFLNNFPSLLEMLIEKRCHRISMENTTDLQFQHIFARLQEKTNHEDRELQHLKHIIKAGITEYLIKTVNSKNLRDGKRAASLNRKQDMYELVKIINDSQNKKTLKKDIKERLSQVKTGFFCRSLLKDSVKEALRIGKEFSSKKQMTTRTL